MCDVCVFHSAVFGEMKLFEVLWFLLQKSLPGKYKSKTDLKVSTVSTRRHALTNIHFDVFIFWIIV